MSNTTEKAKQRVRSTDEVYYGKEHLLLVLYTISYLLGHPPDYSIIMEDCTQPISYYDSHIFFQGTDFLESLPIL